MASSSKEVLEVAGREVTVTNPGKVYFPKSGRTKLDVVRYYVAVAEGALRGAGGRPMALKRYVNGIDGEAFFQKRAPEKRPEWIETAQLRYPSGRTAEEIVLRDAAQLAWVVNLGCLELHTHSVLAEDVEHPDELRIDLDPVPGVPWSQVLEVALVARDVLADHGLVGWPKTSGSRGFHVYARIHPNWTFAEVRRAAEGFAREVARRAPDIATGAWWKEERHGVFVDYNQNAKDHTTASGYSVRPSEEARVSTPLTWDEVPDCDPAAYTMETVPGRPDAWAGIEDARGDLTPLLELAATFKKQAPAKKGTGRRAPSMPLIEIARAATKEEALEGLERWKARHPAVWPLLEPADVLVDSMRGINSLWTRIRLNLVHVPEADRPPQEPLEVDYDPFAKWKELQARGEVPARRRRPAAGEEAPEGV
ncbi:non-homologous end-joining DNA ligase [Dactylosporangium aurantiacum]|uniref:Non-homologous end-joining DNA ligase n=1 Tax=Dactylosporangium aurantiacum TaxID=35754 RepID=A0A9Q9IB18_9ACTN|nr:non-homologous end-joining DNA ligase [Dactylosporangium aurantiacum]MDG6102576.1 non-homologous end-joining DNA ligase [Dactylosporangium aurantiacum]UWZ53159.1 non-homologous end-joining DNA ligase [Dactylosporangium aurantiacum]